MSQQSKRAVFLLGDHNKGGFYRRQQNKIKKCFFLKIFQWKRAKTHSRRVVTDSSVPAASGKHSELCVNNNTATFPVKARAQRVSTYWLELVGYSSPKEDQRHSGWWDGSRENNTDNISTGVPGSREGHLGPSSYSCSNEHYGELGNRVYALVSRLQDPDIFWLGQGAQVEEIGRLLKI